MGLNLLSHRDPDAFGIRMNIMTHLNVTAKTSFGWYRFFSIKMKHKVALLLISLPLSFILLCTFLIEKLIFWECCVFLGPQKSQMTFLVFPYLFQNKCSQNKHTNINTYH